MRGRGDWELAGVEPDASAAEQARQQGLTVYQAPLAQVILPSESFDVVTLWDVLEHLPSPQDALTRIRGWLRPGGWLVIRTPDADSPYARFFGRTWAGLDAPRHPVVFSRSTLSRLLTECGFHVERMWVLSGSHASTVLSCRFWLQERGWNAEWSRLLDNPLAQVVTAPLFWLIDRWGGAAVTVVSQRKD
jgi:predicted SAM-dependent methyltransferase